MPCPGCHRAAAARRAHAVAHVPRKVQGRRRRGSSSSVGSLRHRQPALLCLPHRLHRRSAAHHLFAPLPHAGHVRHASDGSARRRWVERQPAVRRSDGDPQEVAAVGRHAAVHPAALPRGRVTILGRRSRPVRPAARRGCGLGDRRRGDADAGGRGAHLGWRLPRGDGGAALALLPAARLGLEEPQPHRSARQLHGRRDAAQPRPHRHLLCPQCARPGHMHWCWCWGACAHAPAPCSAQLPP